MSASSKELHDMSISRARAFSSARFLLKKNNPNFAPYPELNEADLEETFIRGTGPGGQKINKTSVVAHLKHIPSGIIVKCQATRSQAQNRIVARRKMQEKLDLLEHGESARSQLKKSIKKKKNQSAQKKKNRKYRALSEEAGQVNEEMQDTDVSKASEATEASDTSDIKS